MDAQRAKLRINLAQREFEVEGSENFVRAYAERLDQLLGWLTRADRSRCRLAAAGQAGR